MKGHIVEDNTYEFHVRSSECYVNPFPRRITKAQKVLEVNGIYKVDIIEGDIHSGKAYLRFLMIFWKRTRDYMNVDFIFIPLDYYSYKSVYSSSDHAERQNILHINITYILFICIS